MKTRCLNPNSKDFEHYGGRGIKVCQSWLIFENFLSDMGIKPRGLTLERRNNNLGYNKSNCYWAEERQQHRNQRSNVNLTYKGRTLNVLDWAAELGLPSRTIYSRIRYGWSVDKILSLTYYRRAREPR